MTSIDITARRPKPATIDDVAAAAGVSVATVSRALRGLPNVAESTRQRVADTANDLDYRPDPAAARLAAGRTGTVTVAVPSLNGWYFSTVVAAAEAVCAEAGLEFQVISIASTQQRDRLLGEAQRIERRTDGLIMVDIAATADQAASLERRRVGLATIGTRIAGHPSVTIDDDLVGRMAAEHLVGLGHRRIAMIGGDSGRTDFAVPMIRRRGFESAVADAGVIFPNEAFANGRFSVVGGYEAMSALLDQPLRPTAVFAMSDEMAFGALMALGEQSLEPGTDMSIVGVDDHEFAQVVGLTTVRQPVAEHGSTAARLLIERMLADEIARRGQGNTASRPLATRSDEAVQPGLSLVVRSTTGPPAVDG